MLSVYLDQNHWIYLSAAAAGAPRRADHVATLKFVRSAVDAGTVVLPLSAQHYIETLRREDDASRQQLALLMIELSRLATIAGPGRVVPAELDAVLNARYGKPTEPLPLQVLGRGYGFAFGHPAYRYTLPKHVRVEDDAQREQLEATMTQLIEVTLLAGPVGGSRLPGAGQMQALDLGGRYAQGERDLAAMLGQPGVPQRDDVVAASEVIDLIEPLNLAFARAGLTAHETPELDTKEGLTELVRSLPSRDVALKLRNRRHANAQTKWEPNDLNDIGALSVAVAYCDVVVTERSWTHYIRATGLDKRYGTTVLASLAQLPAVIDSLSTTSAASDASERTGQQEAG